MTGHEQYEAALEKWKQNGGARPALRPDNIPTRIDLNWMTPAELAILAAMQAVEDAGGSIALTEAVDLLVDARSRVADHVEALEVIKVVAGKSLLREPSRVPVIDPRKPAQRGFKPRGMA